MFPGENRRPSRAKKGKLELGPEMAAEPSHLAELDFLEPRRIDRAARGEDPELDVLPIDFPGCQQPVPRLQELAPIALDPSGGLLKKPPVDVDAPAAFGSRLRALRCGLGLPVLAVRRHWAAMAGLASPSHVPTATRLAAARTSSTRTSRRQRM